MGAVSVKWLKLYNEARTDKKLAPLTLAERGVWVNLLCYANEQEDRGTFDASDLLDLALECADGDEAVMQSALDKLVKVKHLVPAEAAGHYTFRTFAERQARKPSDEPQAVLKRKQAQRQREAISHGVTRDRGVTNAMSRERADVTRLDIRDKSKESNTSPNLSPKRKSNTSPFAAASAGGVRGKPTNPIWDALASVTGIQPQTASERSRRGKAVKELREVGATAEEIARRADRYRMVFPSATLTDTALVAHWSECDPTRPIPFPKARTYARAAPEPPELDLHAPPLEWK